MVLNKKINMITKEQLGGYLEKIGTFFHNLSKVAMILVAVGAGFGACKLVDYIELQSKKVPKEMQATRNIKETSIAINERNELMIIDRKDGSYVIYQDSVGKNIFLLYANQNYNPKQITK